RDSASGGRFTHEVELEPGESEDLWFWVVLSDRMTYTHFPNFAEMRQQLEAHDHAWTAFWQVSSVQWGDPEMEDLYKSCLYTIRCNASPWYVAPGILSTHWEGRTFHDDFYPFLGLLSGNHRELAERMPNYRLHTLPVAIRRAAGQGAYYGWEVAEDGEECAPYGHWTDEQFRHGIFSEQIWRYYLHTRDRESLTRYYPVLRGCAEWLIHDVLERDDAGDLKTRLITDADETVFPVRNSIFVASATVRSLNNAARAAEILGLDATRRQTYRSLAQELRANLPLDDTGTSYAYADNARTPQGSHRLATVFPFSFDIHSQRARETATRIYEAFRTGERRTTWIWGIGRLCAAFFYQGRGDEGYQILRHALAITSAFLAPSEHLREDKGPYLPWFATGAGAFVYAVHAMFLQVVDEGSAILLPALPSHVRDARFTGLLASHGVVFSGEVKNEALVSLVARSDRSMAYRFRIPQQVAADTSFRPGLTLSKPDEQGLVTVHCSLARGATRLV
ncbi:MAG TPA: hypothetical protein VM537_10105, partial [Anaerolineae bacterium]|nr:hypothetical protein [Anaerolineae bacterium]